MPVSPQAIWNSVYLRYLSNSAYQFYYIKYGILYISDMKITVTFYSIKNRILCMLHMKITMLMSLHKILNFLYFTLLKSVCKVFYMKHGILYTSYMKTWVVIFLHYIRDTLHFTHENQGIGFLKIRRSNMVLVMPLFHK